MEKDLEKWGGSTLFVVGVTTTVNKQANEQKDGRWTNQSMNEQTNQQINK